MNPQPILSVLVLEFGWKRIVTASATTTESNPREFVVYTDESDKDGKYFSNFYGGALVRSTDLREVIERLEASKRRLNLFQEVKWQKVTANYLQKYVELMGEFFDLVAADKIKVRIMFTQNRFVPKGLTPEQRRIGYYLLYFQFLKHAFGLPFANRVSSPISVRLNLDQLPNNREQNATFKGYVLGLNLNPRFRAARVGFRADQIAEVRSHDHVLMQCLDVALGAICFRLNDKHKDKPAGERIRGKKTIAKEKLYKFLLGRIRGIRPGFNIGDTTGKDGDWSNLWNHSYRHWKFIPKDHDIDGTRDKPK